MRKRGIALRLSIAAVIGVLVVEMFLHWLLFDASWSTQRRLYRLSHPDTYFDRQSEDLFWRVALRQSQRGMQVADTLLHPELGWLAAPVDPQTYVLKKPGQPGDTRREVLLFGDSFAQCTTTAEHCFQGLLQRSELAASHRLLNFGCGGYGFDQIYLLMSKALPSYREARPVVIVSLLLEDDLDRCVLTLRSAPKPRFVQRGSQWELESPTVPSREHYFDHHPLPLQSLLWKALRRRLDPIDESIEHEKEALSRALLEKTCDELQAAGVEAFVLLFHAENHVDGRLPRSWRDTVIREVLSARGLPYVDTEPYLRDDARQTGRPIADYYTHEEPIAGHMNELGNEVSFRAILAGLEGDFSSGSAAKDDESR